MKYWQESFGYVAVVAGIAVLITGHVAVWLLDGRLRRNLVIRLREKARKFELKYGAQMQREDGLFLRVDQRKKFNMAPGADAALASTKKNFKEGKEETKKDKRRKSVMPMKKKVFEDDEDESSSEEDERMVKNLKIGGDGEEDDAAIKE